MLLDVFIKFCADFDGIISSLSITCTLKIFTYTIEEAMAYQGQQAVFKWHNLSLLTAMLTSGNVFKVYKIVLLCDNSLLDYVRLC